MSKNPYIALHTSVFLFGFTPILGKLLSLNAYSLVWWRMCIASLIFLVFPKFFEQLKSLNRKQLILFIGIGFLVALHWITFYGSIKVANSASLTLACFGLTATFTSFLEPFINRQKVILSDIVLGLLAFGGILFIFLSSAHTSIPAEKFSIALGLGIFSSSIAAFFSSLNAKFIKSAQPVPVTFVELSSGFMFLSLFFMLISPASFEWLNNESDFIWMLLLTIFCTNIAFALNLQAMKKISAFIANITINLEPVYGILWAVIIFSENRMLNSHFYLGAVVILFTVLLHSFLKRKKLFSKQLE
ncbi:MAG: DMT family transporter [Bacteroidia bacterium]|nr:DMT family transporter [Bacteroidia bacterium]